MRTFHSGLIQISVTMVTIWIGVDTSLSDVCINGEVEDAQYSAFGLAPAAIGYDYFAGPKIPGEPTDTAIFNLQKLPGYKNMPATSFDYFSAGGTYSDPGPMVMLKLRVL